MSKFAALFFFLPLLVASLSVRSVSNATTSERIAIPPPDVDRLIQRALELRLDENIQWIRLGHYRKARFGGWRSEADNSLFFVAKDGQTNPRNELIETLRKGFAQTALPPAIPKAPAMTVRCQYPARWKWLMKELAVDSASLPHEECLRYQEFLKLQKPQSVTLVFSGFFVDNPSSSFGHVLLRLNKGPHDTNRASAGAELLDYGVTYAANPTSENPVIYAIGGFAGWFPSMFSSIPFYYKVREYSDAESRDLWEYDLNLSPEEVDRLGDHVWEMGSTYFYYYYLTKNCAYHLLGLLEAAAPRLRLIDRMPFYVIPVDSVKAISREPGLVARVSYRPSTQKQLEERFRTLNAEERDVFLKIRNTPQPASGVKDLQPVSAARVLDTVLDDIDYRNFRELVFKTNPTVAARKQNVLVARAALPPGGEIHVPVTLEDRPDRSHDSGRWSIAGGSQVDTSPAPNFERRAMIDAEVRFALHDINDPLDGYLKYSTVEFWRMQGRLYPVSGRAELQSFALMTINSFSPLRTLEKKPAWRVSLGADRVRDRRCDGCLGTYGFAYGGLSLEPLRGIMLYGLLGPKGETSPGYAQAKWLASVAGTAGVRWKIMNAWQLAGEYEWRRVYDFETFDRNRVQAIFRWDHRSENRATPLAIQAEFVQEVSAQDFLLRVLRYF